jgi:hypothetical protein
MRRYTVACIIAVLVLAAFGTSARAQLSGAIFTTTANGGAVNFNIYPSKDAVYLSGGPPPNAPPTAAGLPDGTYVFQVTDPSGKTLLSTDIANCRQFTVSGGNINGVVVTGCQHHTGLSVDGEVTVQLIPFLDTPNNGGEYKAWATPVANYLQGCSALGVANGLSVVDCGMTGGDVHGFIPSHSKTDNFKVSAQEVNREVDTYFYDPNLNLLAGLCEIWIDTLGVSNPRCSGPPNTSAKVEDLEDGIHQFVISSQTGCTTFTGGVSEYVGNNLTTSQTFSGGPGSPVTVDIQIKPNFTGSIIIDVYCSP